MPLVWTIHVQSQNGNTQIHIKIIPMEQADSACGFRLPGENFWWRKICRLHMALRPFPGLDLPCFRPPIAAMFCRSTPFFSDWTIWQHPSALLSIYSSTFQRSFFLRDFIPEFVLRFSCRQSLLQAQSTLIFQQACRKEVLDTNISPKFGRCMWHHTVGHPQMICCACMGQDEDAFTNLPYHPVADGVLKHERKGLRDHVTKKKKQQDSLQRSVHHGKGVTWYSSQCMTEYKCLQQICKYTAVTKQATTKPKACLEGCLKDRVNM